LVIIFIFASGVYLKHASVSQKLIVPKLEDHVLRYRLLKMEAISRQQKVFACNFLLPVCRLRRSPWQTRLERICVGTQEEWHTSDFNSNTYEETHTFLYTTMKSSKD
jgi:hypothetical protein